VKVEDPTRNGGDEGNHTTVDEPKKRRGLWHLI
jgi:hypothetical protein